MTLCLRDRDLDWREIDDEIVALDGRQAVYLALRGSGALVWRLLAEPTTPEALTEALVERYDIDAAQARTDVDSFLASLTERALLVS